MKKINKDFIYNIIYQVFTFIIPLITIPYISRVFGAEKIGIYSYSYSIVYYFMLITLLGINNYGAKNIAKNSGNRSSLSNVFCSIYYLQLFNGLIVLLIYNLFVLLFIKTNRNIFFIQNIYLLSAILDINWLYFGLEKFKLTISRNIIIKLFSLLLIFIFVKEKNDLWIYTLIMSLGTLISQMYLWLFLKNNVDFAFISFKKIFENLKPCLLYFIPVISYSIYRVMDKTMLGSISGMFSLGLYENAEKIVNIPVGILSALGTVMLPNMSKIFEKKEIEKKILENSELCFMIICPIIFGLFSISRDFSTIFFGKDFLKSGMIICFLLPSVIFATVTNLIRTNYLIPQGKDKVYVNSTIVGATMNLIINLLLIPKYNIYGACIGTIAAEFFVMLYQIIKVKKEIPYVKILQLLIKYVIKSLIMLIIINIVGFFINNLYVKIFVQIFLGIGIYLFLNFKYIHDEFLSLGGNK